MITDIFFSVEMKITVTGRVCFVMGRLNTTLNISLNLHDLLFIFWQRERPSLNPQLHHVNLKLPL